MKKRLLFLCLTFSVCGYAQKRDTVLKYLNAALNFTTRKNTVYAGAAIRQKNVWYLYALYPDNSYVLRMYYKDKALTVKEGPYDVYYSKNSPAIAGFYHDNSMTGVWRSWYGNRQLKDSGFLYYNIHMGLWKAWYENGQLQEETAFKTDMTIQPFNLSQAIARL